MTLFDAQAARNPTRIGQLRLMVDVSIAEDGTRFYQGRTNYTVLDQNGNEIATPIGDPAPELTAQQIQSQKQVVDTLVDKAEATLP